jgi:hypothetical protein
MSRRRPLLTSIIAVLALIFALGGTGIAASRSPQVYFFRLDGDAQEPQVRPSQIVFAADGNWDVTGLHWRDWGGPVARANGTETWTNCIPDCGNGERFRAPVHVTLWQRGRRDGLEMYLCYHFYSTVEPEAPVRQECPG